MAQLFRANCTSFTIGDKFRNFMELYEFYVLLDNAGLQHAIGLLVDRSDRSDISML